MQPTPYRCGQWIPTDGDHCKALARLYPAGWRCDEHSPSRQAKALPAPRPSSLADFGTIREAARYSGCKITDLPSI